MGGCLFQTQLAQCPCRHTRGLAPTPAPLTCPCRSSLFLPCCRPPPPAAHRVPLELASTHTPGLILFPWLAPLHPAMHTLWERRPARLCWHLLGPWALARPASQRALHPMVGLGAVWSVGGIQADLGSELQTLQGPLFVLEVPDCAFAESVQHTL